MAIYAYADETSFTVNGKTNEIALGSGIFVSKSKVNQDIVREALADLKSDIDFDHQKDLRTIQRGYFHSSDDSKNAHSHLCCSINRNIVGIFDYTYFDNITQVDIIRKGFADRIFDRCLSHSTLALFLSTNEVFLTIEKRDSINEVTISMWLNSLYKRYEGATYNRPSYKTFYPKINIFLEDKMEPGLQVVDFLMWAVNRTKISVPDNRWHERIKYKTWYYYKDAGNQNRGKYHLNTFPDKYSAIDNDYPHKFEEPEEWSSFLNAYVNIERFLVSVDRSDFTDKTMHLFDDFHSISSKLKSNDYYLIGDDITLIGSVFLRLFDSLPLYGHLKDNDKDSWVCLLHAKYLASMLVRNDQLHFNRTRNEIQRWRYKMQTENEDEFKKLIYSS